jgi:hypothetical protein
VVGPIVDDSTYPFSLSGPITATSEIVIERYIAFTCNENCSPDDLIVNKEPDFLPASEYECNDNIEGTVNDNNVVNTWYLDKRFYRLTKVKMWKDDVEVSGFEVTYSPPDDFIGWSELTNVFGT